MVVAWLMFQCTGGEPALVGYFGKYSFLVIWLF